MTYFSDGQKVQVAERYGEIREVNAQVINLQKLVSSVKLENPSTVTRSGPVFGLPVCWVPRVNTLWEDGRLQSPGHH